MTSYGGWVSGIFPIKLDSLRKKINRKYKEYDIEEDRSEYIRLQVKNNFSYISETQLEWRDLAYPFEKIGKSISKEKIRFLGGKLCAYKRIYKDIQIIDKNVLTDVFKYNRLKELKWKFSILGPYTFYKVIEVPNYDKEKFIQKIYGKIFDDALELEFNAIDIHDPLICYQGFDEDNLIKRLYVILKSYPMLKFFIYPYCMDFRDKLALLIDIARDGFVIDLNYVNIGDLIPIPLDRVIIGIDELILEEEIQIFIRRLKYLVRRIRYKEIDFTYPYSLNIMSHDTCIKKMKLIGLLLKGVR